MILGHFLLHTSYPVGDSPFGSLPRSFPHTITLIALNLSKYYNYICIVFLVIIKNVSFAFTFSRFDFRVLYSVLVTFLTSAESINAHICYSEFSFPLSAKFNLTLIKFNLILTLLPTLDIVILLSYGHFGRIIKTHS